MLHYRKLILGSFWLFLERKLSIAYYLYSSLCTCQLRCTQSDSVHRHSVFTSLRFPWQIEVCCWTLWWKPKFVLQGPWPLLSWPLWYSETKHSACMQPELENCHTAEPFHGSHGRKTVWQWKLSWFGLKKSQVCVPPFMTCHICPTCSLAILPPSSVKMLSDIVNVITFSWPFSSFAWLV